jgi:hypothetical protein
MTFVPHDVINCKVDDCFACKCESFSIGGAALVTRKPGIVDRVKTEREYSKNRPAYVRLKQEGLQPKRFTDAAKVEATAVSKFEVESGQDFKGDERKGRRADEVQLALRTGTGIDV